MRKKLFLALLGLVALSSPSFASFGTPTQLGTGNGTTTAVITTGADAPVGSLIVVTIAVATTGIPVTSVTDSAGNCSGAYTVLDNTAVGSRPTSAIFYCPTTGIDLPSGGLITVTVPAADKVAATAFAISGGAASPADAHGNQANSSGTGPSTTNTGVRSQGGELILGVLALDRASGGFVANTFGYTSIGGVSSANGSAYNAWALSCGTASIPFSASWSVSSFFMINAVSFKSAAIDQMCVEKTNGYAVLGSSVEQSSKMDAYAVLGSTVEQSSKMNAYIALSTATMQSSKTNAYIVLAPGTASSGLSFHSFPP